VTYAGAYGRNERVPVDRMLRREGHPLGVRRAEATKAATEEPEDTSLSHKRWTLGAAAGALLVAGTFTAAALGLSGGATPAAGSAPEIAPTAPNHKSGPEAGAPAPGQENKQQQDQQAQPKQQPQETTPASTGPNTGAPVNQGSDAGTDQSGGGSASGDSQRSNPGSGGGTSTPAPSPSPSPAPEQPAPEQQGPVGGLLDTVGDVLSPVTGAVGGILSPSSASTTDNATASSKVAPSGPALTMINPLADLLAS
jgi:hypothetical protein